MGIAAAPASFLLETGKLGYHISRPPTSGSDKQTTNEQRDKAPELSVPHTVVKLGEVAAGKVVEAVFQIGNTGQSPLVIRKVAVPTSAITVDPAQTKNPILPGKTLQLKVKLNTTGLNGNYVNRITLVTNAPAQTMLFLELQAMVK